MLERSDARRRHGLRGLALGAVVGTLVFAASAKPGFGGDTGTVAATGATAGVGVSVDLGQVRVDQALTPGGGYRLPTIGVRNPGTVPTRYRMTVTPFAGRQLAPPAVWFSFEPREFVLAPGATRPVQQRLRLPAGADPGDYGGLVGAEIVTGGRGAEAGAAAAARVTFTVEPSTLLQALWLRLKTFVGDATPWSWLVPALVGLGMATRLVRRRFTITLGRRA